MSGSPILTYLFIFGFLRKCLLYPRLSALHEAERLNWLHDWHVPTWCLLGQQPRNYEDNWLKTKTSQTRSFSVFQDRALNPGPPISQTSTTELHLSSLSILFKFLNFLLLFDLFFLVSGWPGDLPVSVSHALGLKMCVTTTTHKKKRERKKKDVCV